MGRTHRELGTTVRSFPSGSYLIFYRPVREGIEILRILHSSRDLSSVWGE